MRKILLTSILSLGILFTGCDNSSSSTSSSSTSNKVLQHNTVKLSPSTVSAPLALSGDKVDNALKHNYVLILDDSGSMSGRDSSGEIKFVGALNAVNTFLSKLTENDTIHFVTLNKGFTNGISNTKKMLSTLVEGGGTPLGQALNHSLSYLNQKVDENNGYGFYTIISITDGESNDPTSKVINDIFNYKKADIVLKTIGFDMPSDNPLNSAQTEYFSASDAATLERVLSSIKAEVDTFSDTPTSFE